MTTFVPQADLAPYDLTDEWIDGVRAKLPELPDQKAARYQDSFGLSAYDSRHLVEHRATSNFFEKGMELAGKRLPSWLSRSRTSRLTTSRRA